MQAVSFLAPALAPLAIKLIDKYIFDDERAPVPQIIQIPAPPQCACRCGQQLSDEYYSTDQTCSTCTSKSSSAYRNSTRHRLSTKSNVRSSSTSDAYDNEKSRMKPRSRSSRRLSDDTGKSGKKSDKHNSDVNTLDVLAAHLKKEISLRHSKGKTSSRVSDSRSTDKSTSSKSKSMSNSRKSSGKSVHESKSSSRKFHHDSQSDGSRVSKAGCSGC